MTAKGRPLPKAPDRQADVRALAMRDAQERTRRTGDEGGLRTSAIEADSPAGGYAGVAPRFSPVLNGHVPR